MHKKLILLSVVVVVQLLVRLYPLGVTTACIFTALDIGQGDAILIQTSDQQDILIDGGPDASVVNRLSQVLPPGNRDIELMVLTHPHADHVNGLVLVTERFTVRHVLETSVPHKLGAYEAWHQLLQDKKIPNSIARAGQSYAVGQATLDVLWPAHDLTKKNIFGDNAAEGGGVNDTSVVLKLNCGGSAAMLMGDASSDIEERIIDDGANVRAGLLKVGHHGSRFSSSVRFLQAVQPTWAVISAGVNNSHHHPHPTVLLRLEQAGLRILRTDVQGDVRLYTDGKGGWTQPHFERSLF